MVEERYSVAAGPEQIDDSDLHVLFAGESRTEPNHKLGPKVYDYFLFHFVEHGKGSFHTEYSTYELTEGDGFLIHPEQLVSYESDSKDPWHYRWIAFNGANSHKFVQRAGFQPELPVFRATANSAIPELLQLTLQAFHHQRNNSHFISLGYLHLVMAEAEAVLQQELRLPEGESGVQRIVKQMIHYMSSQYAHPVSIEQMCASLGYNRAYLSRIFKKETGISPVTYLLKLRIDKARHLLRERPELSIEQIASSVGLTDALYFSRQFRRFHGEAPSHYRQTVKGKK